MLKVKYIYRIDCDMMHYPWWFSGNIYFTLMRKGRQFLYNMHFIPTAI